MKSLFVCIILILMSSSVFAGLQREVIPSFEKDNIVVLNEEIRKLRNDINNVGNIYSYQSNIFLDDATVSLPDERYGVVIVSCNAEAGMWLVESDGTCTKIVGTVNTADTDSDTDLCVYDGGTKGIVKNRLGTSGKIVIDYRYN